MEKMYEKPKLTHFFIFICLVVFILEIVFENFYGEEFLSAIFYNFGLSLQNVLLGRMWVFITSIFLHASPEHLVLNILALYFFGRAVELELGRKKFLLAFFMSSFVADMLVLSSTLVGITAIDIPTIGASAAIFGLMGVAMVTKPLEFIFYPYLIPVPLFLVALIYTLYNIASFLMFFLSGVSTQVSYLSHIGGVIGGLLLGFREERSRKGFIILLFITLLLLTTPFIFIIIGFLENFNYVNIIAGLFS